MSGYLLKRCLFLSVWIPMYLVAGSKILLLPVNHGSHVNMFSSIGSVLKARGHQVYILCGKSHVKIAAENGIEPIVPNSNMEKGILESVMENNNVSLDINVFSQMSEVLNKIKNEVRELFKDKVTMDKIKVIGFDLMIIDGFDPNRYMYALPYKLSIPYVTITARVDPWTFRIPAMPSVEGFPPFYNLNADSGIFHRGMTLFAYLVSLILTPPSPVSIIDDSFISEVVPEKENIGYAKLFVGSELVLVNMDIVCLESPRVSSPYYQFIGGLGAKKAKPLTDKFNSIMANASDGVIILTFGSAIKKIPDEMLDKYMKTFKQLKQTVIMRNTDFDSAALPPNVHMTSWMPQNDLLAHPNTKLFITHGGNNGQLEAVYHGVPMLTMPLFGDQPYNARRSEGKGFGKTLDVHTFTSDELLNTVNEIVNNDTYRDTIKHCSKIQHALPSPQDKAVFWIEHVLEFGGSHLRPYYIDMPLWRFFMLDIMIIDVCVIVLLIMCVRLCCKKCCKSKSTIHIKAD